MTPQRIQRQRTKGWRMPEGAVYVGRPTMWGNPFDAATYGLRMSVALYGDIARGLWRPALLVHFADEDFAEANRLADEWRKRIGVHPVEAARADLAGKDLACWCPLDQPCHGAILIAIANGEVLP